MESGPVVTRILDAAALREISSDPPLLARYAADALSRSAERGALWWAVSVPLAFSSPVRRRAAIAGAVAWTAATGLANGPLKGVTRRRRPASLLLGLRPLGRRPVTSSFPSSHAAGAFGYATAAGAISPGIAIPLVGLAAAVSWSRLQSARHYPLDVVGGAVLGAGVGVAVGLIARSRWETDQPSSD